jgi:glucose/arabinose dehydrogenase
VTLRFPDLRRSSARHTLLPLVLALAACGTPPAEAGTPDPEAPVQTPAVQLEEVVTGLEQPTTVVSAADGSNRLFVTQKTGLARIVQDGSVLDTPFLDLTGAVSTASEQGLLGLAFHPQYAENGRFFVNYTREDGDTVISEFAVSGDPNVAAADSERVLLIIPQPYANHNGGQLAFGPDGYLYIGMGDGGDGGDPEENGQDPSTLLGSMLRIDVDVDVDNGDPYAVPEDNPFVGDESAAPETWAYGLRNPWRFSFDRETGDLWIADVGQNAFEEVNRQPADSTGGENYGWDITEGSSCFNEENAGIPLETCDREGLTGPVLEYPRSEGQSVTGGYVYRGEAIPSLNGFYVFGDYASGTIWGAAAQEGGGYASTELLEAGFPVVTFGEDEAGELYVADFGGTLYRFAPGN